MKVCQRPSESGVGLEAYLASAGQAPGADTVSGSITVPEVAHDTEESEYVVCPLLSYPCLLAPILTRQ